MSSYRVTYADLAPSPPQLREAAPPDSPDITDDDLTLPDRSRDLVQRWSDEVTRGQGNALDKAIAIQDHLRDTSRYTYSLDLGEPLRDSQGRLLEPIQNFYETRRGYCVQFATAMIMMARAQGIPARMAIGFLPGQLSGEHYVVRASDAHAWPELYFQGYGWLRFEPTPGARSGSPPPYAVLGAGSGATGGGRQVTEPGSRGASTGRPSPTTTEAAAAPAPQQQGVLASLGALFTLRNVVLVVAVLVGLLAAFAMPITAWLLRWRRRRRAVTQQDLIEVEWDELTSHLGDLGHRRTRRGDAAPAARALRREWPSRRGERHRDATGHGHPREVTLRPARAHDAAGGVPAARRHPVDPASGGAHPCLAGPDAVLLLARCRRLVLALAPDRLLHRRR